MKQHIVVVGNGMVGHHFLEQLVAKNTESEFKITVLAEEPRPAYDRVHLSEFFGGKSADDLAMGTESLYQQWGVELRLSAKVTAIDSGSKTITINDAETVNYDQLVLATGSYPFVPPIPGNEHNNCLVYRTIEDLQAIQSCASSAKTGVVVGGGLLGLEAANALKSLGLETHVVEFAPGLMSVQLDAEGGATLREMIEEIGVSVHTEKATQQITALDNDDALLRMDFADETHLDTDLIVFSAGIRPRDELAKLAGLTVGERGGIVIDSRCQTSDSNIYAIGECALYDNRIFGLVAPGYTMARTVVSQLTGGSDEFTGADMSTKLKLLGCDVGSIGDAHGRTPGALSYQLKDERNRVYKRLITSADGKKMLGAVLVGDCSDYDTLLQYHLNDINLPENPEQLILPAGHGDAPALGVDALPATASICSCHNVSKGDIVAAVEAGCCSLGDVKAETKASTGCGGCAALLKNVVDAELSARGVEVSTDICEHFAFSRQELFHLIQVEEIKTFEQLLQRHGKGLGCDVCKPLAGSIFASLWNDYVLEQPHYGLQDTNDRYLANMQKDGTYSIVPRIAGGEITPDKLIVLGEVAKQYDLYTKITGGQRIDLFGARLDQLPEIWSKLVDAGFETGHAYGKAVRTVKSCVGSTWCRYGVQDSVGMAIHIEDRYKGLRAPHKLKFAVSGCTRECAEAQSKDIGVIATENGWNLYVCGNGGMKPRHADLFATDLDDETLIKYIDRILMFYIRTADRLQRTSVWMENLEGGLAYLQDVVINDSLGLAEQLEQRMAHVVSTYQCEWKTTLGDEQKLKKFRQFVNDPGQDEQVVFVRERSQIRPATEAEKQELAKTA